MVTISHHGIIEKLAWEWMGVVYDADDTSFTLPSQSSSFPCEKVAHARRAAHGGFGAYIFGSRPAVSSCQISTSAASAGFSINDVRVSMDWLSGLLLYTFALRSL